MAKIFGRTDVYIHGAVFDKTRKKAEEHALDQAEDQAEEKACTQNKTALYFIEEDGMGESLNEVSRPPFVPEVDLREISEDGAFYLRIKTGTVEMDFGVQLDYDELAGFMQAGVKAVNRAVNAIGSMVALKRMK